MPLFIDTHHRPQNNPCVDWPDLIPFLAGVLDCAGVFDSCPGNGVRFHFTLPLCSPENKAHCEDVNSFL